VFRVGFFHIFGSEVNIDKSFESLFGSILGFEMSIKMNFIVKNPEKTHTKISHYKT
jgi:hypothetical protein